jgi:hypothetical protein
MGIFARHVYRVLLVGLCSVATMAGLGGALPDAAEAFATVAPLPTYSSAPGLPDGRVYEEVSPSNKHANSAGAQVNSGAETFGIGEPVASPDGNAVLFYGEGAIGEAASGLDSVYIANRSLGGWSTRSAVPTPFDLEEGAGGLAILVAKPFWIDPARDLSHVVFSAQLAYINEPPYQVAGGVNEFANIYLAGTDPLAPPTWIARPGSGNVTIPPNPEFAAVPVGGSPDLSTIYFTYPGTLGLPGEAARATQVPSESDWGLYEYKNGVLSNAGVLPDGSLSPDGAVPAALASASPGARTYVPANLLDNEVSADGSRVFFVSPDPLTAGPTELYVRVTAPDGSQSTVLVSQSQLPGQVGQPAPDGAVAVAGPVLEEENPNDRASSFVYASPDGSHAFFASVDRLTSQAPSDASLKEYDFDIDTQELTYLPGVSGPILAAAQEGSSFLFDNTAQPRTEIDRWSAGPEGGTVTPVVPDASAGLARATANGAVFVFQSQTPIPGFNDAGHFLQVFRYDVASNELNCVSCPPTGIVPSGRAVLSNLTIEGAGPKSGARNGLVENRGMSADGGRVFFDTPDPLVPQDTNGKYDVYEWENGTIFLISSGTSARDSVFLDNSEDGDDVFFATVDALVPGDTEGSYDVYDARVPHPGDNPPPAAVPCQGDVCQGPPSTPSLLGTPASATFNGLGNIAPQPQAASPAKKRAAPRKQKKVKRRKKPHGKRKGLAGKVEHGGMVKHGDGRGK